jgi:prepilin-type N-terminal cleavage/methylation domain-containing protein
MRRTSPGFTLLELLIALAIVAALVAIALGGLRVGAAAWQQGEDRAEAHQHARSLAEILARSVTGSFPYRAAPREGGEARILFAGEENRLAFVTLSPPFPAAAPIAFTAVVFSLEAGERPGLAIREKALPNFEPFETEKPFLVDPSVAEVSFRYLRPGGDWEESWDGAEEKQLPEAVQISLTTVVKGKRETFPPLTASLKANLP